MDPKNLCTSSQFLMVTGFVKASVEENELVSHKFFLNLNSSNGLSFVVPTS